MQNIEKVVLPSNGLLDAPQEVTIRAMVGREISTIYSSLNGESVNEVIRAVTDPSLDPSKLCDEDKAYILHKTRTLTFGDTIVQTLKCPYCGHIQEYTVSYEEFDTKLLTEEMASTTVELSNGDTVTRRIPTKADWKAIDNHKKKRNLSDAYSYILLVASRVGEINGESKPASEVVNYLEELRANDLVAIDKAFGERFGLDTTYDRKCGSCKQNIKGGVGINADMFR